MVSTIGEEKAFNPRLQVSSKAAYIELMNNLNLPNPKMMDVAVPENIKMGITVDAQKQVNFVDGDKLAAMAQGDFVLIDLREDGERARHGVIQGAVHAPYSQFYNQLDVLGAYGTKPIIFFCAAGERSAMAVRMAHDKGYDNVAHLIGGFTAWQSQGHSIRCISLICCDKATACFKTDSGAEYRVSHCECRGVRTVPLSYLIPYG